MNTLAKTITENGVSKTYFEASDYISFAIIGFIIFLAIIIAVKFITYGIKTRNKALAELEVPIDEAKITEIEARVLKNE